ncbi:hypothetical protein LSAT2_012025, partial [Lamellibrachia satsuma]
MASVFLLFLIVTELASLSVIRGAARKSRKSLVPWFLSIGPVCLYGSVLVVLDCVIYVSVSVVLLLMFFKLVDIAFIKQITAVTNVSSL